MTIHDKLQKVQENLKAPKGQFNAFGKYKYRNCEDILNAVKPLLAEYGLTIIISDKAVFLGGRHYIKATATLYDGEQYIDATAYAREEDMQKGMSAPQLTGATSSYARKYALNGLLLIDDTKDADATNTHGKYAKETMGMTHQEIAADWPVEQRQAALDKALGELAGIGDVETFKAKKADFNKLWRDFNRYKQTDMAEELTEAINTVKKDLGVE